jgi:lysyl-tRNA synthetase class 1
LVKGAGAKLSSSSGQLITLGEALEIYEPAVVRFIFASRKPNTDFSIAFDLDVMKAYDDFDRVERIAFGLEDVDDRRRAYEKRIYEFSSVQMGTQSQSAGDLPAQFGFRHLCNILQIHQGEMEKAKKYFSDLIKTAEDEKRFYARAARAWKWIHAFAPEEFRFAVRTEGNPPPKTQYPRPMKDLVTLLRTGKLQTMTEDQVANEIYEIIKGAGIPPKLFFQETYNLLISKTSGPKLASFLISLGTERAADILEQALN